MKEYLEKLDELVILAKELEEISYEKNEDLATYHLLFAASSIRELLQSIAELAKRLNEWRPF